MHFTVIHATGKLKAFLDARAGGASHETLKKLSVEAMEEQAEQRAGAAVPAVVVDLDDARMKRRQNPSRTIGVNHR